MKTELGTRNKEIFVSLLRKTKRKHFDDQQMLLIIRTFGKE